MKTLILSVSFKQSFISEAPPREINDRLEEISRILAVEIDKRAISRSVRDYIGRENWDFSLAVSKSGLDAAKEHNVLFQKELWAFPIYLCLVSTQIEYMESARPHSTFYESRVSQSRLESPTHNDAN